MTTTRLVGLTLLLAACGSSPSTGRQDGGAGGMTDGGAGGVAGATVAAGTTGGSGIAGAGGAGTGAVTGIGGGDAGGQATAGSGGGAAGAGAGGAASGDGDGATSAGRGGTAAGGRSGAGGAAGASLGTWTMLASMPLGARQEHGVAAANGIVYVIGNYNFGATTNPDARRLEAYDPATGIWSTRAQIPFAADHPNVAAANGKLYILGAVGTTQSAEYDPATDAWTTRRNTPTQRAASAVAAIGNKIYVAGGAPGNNTAMFDASVRDFMAYDVTTDTFEILEQIPGPGRNHGPGAAADGIFYILGGRTGGPMDGLQSRVDAYDPVAKQWSSRAAMPRARGGCSAGVINGHIVVVGGEGNAVSANANRVFPETDVYDPVANTWRTMAPMRTPRHGMGAAGIGNTLYVPGGATAQGGGTAVAILEAFSL